MFFQDHFMFQDFLLKPPRSLYYRLADFMIYSMFIFAIILLFSIEITCKYFQMFRLISGLYFFSTFVQINQI